MEKAEPSPDSAVASTSDLNEFPDEQILNHEIINKEDQGANLLDELGRIFQKSTTSNMNGMEWINDEDMLFGRIIGLRFKNLSHAHKREVFQLFFNRTTF